MASFLPLFPVPVTKSLFDKFIILVVLVSVLVVVHQVAAYLHEYRYCPLREGYAHYASEIYFRNSPCLRRGDFENYIPYHQKIVDELYDIQDAFTATRKETEASVSLY